MFGFDRITLKLKLLWVLLVLGLAPACGPVNQGGAETDPQAGRGAPVPTHVLTEANAETLTEAEAGDWIEVHLPEPVEPLEWEQRGRHDLEPAGPAEGELQETEEGPRRVFRYRALAVGRTSVTFALVLPESDRPPRRQLTFPVEVL